MRITQVLLINPWDYLGPNDMSGNNPGTNAVRAFFVEWYNLLFILGAIGLVLSLMWCGISLMLGKNKDKAADAKGAIGFKILIAIGISSFLTIVGIFMNVVKGLV